MCNGIAVIVFQKDNQLRGFCTGISSHDELCKLDEDLRYGKIEPYRFELLYPCNLIYDRSSDLDGSIGIAKEQPSQKIWEIAFDVAKPFFMKHNLMQLQFANLRSTNLTNANLKGANMRGAYLMNACLKNANLTYANLKEADLRDANLINANLTGANLTDANLKGANLTDADLTGTNLKDADLTGTKGI